MGHRTQPHRLLPWVGQRLKCDLRHDLRQKLRRNKIRKELGQEPKWELRRQIGLGHRCVYFDSDSDMGTNPDTGLGTGSDKKKTKIKLSIGLDLDSSIGITSSSPCLSPSLWLSHCPCLKGLRTLTWA